MAAVTIPGSQSMYKGLPTVIGYSEGGRTFRLFSCRNFHDDAPNLVIKTTDGIYTLMPRDPNRGFQEHVSNFENYGELEEFLKMKS